MKTRMLFAACTMFLVATSAADAATISSPAIFGSHDQNQATCVALNIGTTTAAVTLKILNESGGTESTTTQTVAPGDFIVTIRNISSGVAYACSATFPSGTKLSAALTIIDIVPDGWGSSNHRPIRSAPLR
jgi:hypothetical protein